MRNNALNEIELTTAVFKWLGSALPKTWAIEPPVWETMVREMAPDRGLGGTAEDLDRGWIADATMILRVGRAKVQLVIEAKTAFEPRLVDSLPRITRWKRTESSDVASRDTREALSPVLVAQYLSPRARMLLTEAGWNYFDLEGNARLACDHPPLFMLLAGSNRAPRSEPRPVRTLRGPAAGRVVRTLTDFSPPFEFQGIAELSRVSAAQVSRLVRLLERDALVEREGRGSIRSVDWPALLQRWSEDYSFLSANKVSRFMALRGRPALMEQLRKTSVQYAITGGVAAEVMKTSAPTRVTTIYTDRVADLARELELEPVPDNPTVILAQPWDGVVFERTMEREGLRFAAPSQVVADLLTSGDRYPMIAETVLEWMKENVGEWRR
jgi:hypothetical protein